MVRVCYVWCVHLFVHYMHCRAAMGFRRCYVKFVVFLTCVLSLFLVFQRIELKGVPLTGVLWILHSVERSTGRQLRRRLSSLLLGNVLIIWSIVLIYIGIMDCVHFFIVFSCLYDRDG